MTIQEIFFRLINDGKDKEARALAEDVFGYEIVASGNEIFYIPDIEYDNIAHIWEWDGHTWWHKDSFEYFE